MDLSKFFLFPLGPKRILPSFLLIRDVGRFIRLVFHRKVNVSSRIFLFIYSNTKGGIFQPNYAHLSILILFLSSPQRLQERQLGVHQRAYPRFIDICGKLHLFGYYCQSASLRHMELGDKGKDWIGFVREAKMSAVENFANMGSARRFFFVILFLFCLQTKYVGLCKLESVATLGMTPHRSIIPSPFSLIPNIR